MADELEQSKESGEKGTKDAVESSAGSGEAAGERLSQEGFPSREESKLASGRGESGAGDQSEQAARISREVSADNIASQGSSKADQQISRTASQSLPQLHLDINRTAQRPAVDNNVAASVAASVDKGSKLFGEMSISQSSTAQEVLKRSDETNPTDNTVSKFADSKKSDPIKVPSTDSSNKVVDAFRSAQTQERRLESAVTPSDNTQAQAIRKSDFQNFPGDKVEKKVSEPVLNSDAVLKSDALKTNSLKDLAGISATSSKIDLSALNETHVAKTDLSKAFDANKASDISSVRQLKEASDFNVTATRNEAVLKADGLTKTTLEAKNQDRFPATNEALRPEKSLSEFKPDARSDKSLVAEKLGASDHVKGPETFRPATDNKAGDALRNESMRQNDKPALDQAAQRASELSRVPESKPEQTRSDSTSRADGTRYTEPTKNNEQFTSTRSADSKSGEELKKPATAVEVNTQAKSDLIKPENTRIEAARPEAVKSETSKPETTAKVDSLKEAAKTEAPVRGPQSEQVRHDDHVNAAATSAAAAAAIAAREAEKANTTSKAAEQQNKVESTANISLNRATVSGINAADTAIQALKPNGEKAATPVSGRDILPAADAKAISLPTADRSAIASNQDLTNKASRLDGSVQQASRLADQVTPAKIDSTAVSLRGEVNTNVRGVERQENPGGKDSVSKADLIGKDGSAAKDGSTASRTDATGKASSDPRCIQFDGQVKGLSTEPSRGDKEFELQGGESDDGDSEEGDNKIKSKRYTVNGNKLYLTGVEISLAALLTMAGAARLRAEKDEKIEKGESECTQDKDTQVFIRRTYMVQEGDTLLSIAEDMYNNRHAAWLIADMNAANIKEAWIDGRRVVELQARQILELPEAEELVQFTAKQRRDFDPEKLVTVVTQNVVDRELLQAFLGTVSGEVSTDTKSAQGTVRASTALPASQQLPELTIEGMEADETRFPPATGLGAVITDFAAMIRQGLKRPTRDLGAVS